jgi:hypothetical protein
MRILGCFWGVILVDFEMGGGGRASSRATAHLSDDEVIAKMGHPAVYEPGKNGRSLREREAGSSLRSE